MRRYINFALRGNMNIHMYDPTLKLVQAVNNPNPPVTVPAVSLSPLTVSSPEKQQEQQRVEEENTAKREEREEREEEQDLFASSPVSR